MKIFLINLLVNLALLGGFFVLRAPVRRRVDRHRMDDEPLVDPGISIEVDCRACGRFNRVPSPRLRDRPRCGSCKKRLMPGRHIVLCRLKPMDGLLSAKLDATWRDEDRLWQCLADHVASETGARKVPPQEVN